MNARVIAVGIGMLVGIIICIVVLIISNNNRKVMTEYDERQNRVRGEAYKISFYVVLILLVAGMLIELADVSLPVAQSVVYVFICIVGIAVNTCYCIWHEVYWGLNNNVRRYVVAMIFIGILNFLLAGLAWKRGHLIENGKLEFAGINLLCGILFVIIAIVGILKKVTTKDTEDASDEEGEG